MKKNGQVFTPSNYVKELLDVVQYKNDLVGKKILENSCGDGNILEEVVLRYIKDCERKGFSKEKIEKNLESDIYGFEIDKEQFEKCKKRLNLVLRNKGLGRVKWSIFNKDFLKTKITKKFDYVVGNPPYITYRDLDNKDQEYLRKNFESCKKGKFDYCYAFIEKSIKCLNIKGKMSYLIPSSIFKTVFGEMVRNQMKPLIESIFDYTDVNIFSDALVKSAIIFLSEEKNMDSLKYIDFHNAREKHIKKEILGDKWIFKNFNLNCGKRFGDYFKVSNTVATLYNKAFVINLEEFVSKEKVYVKGELKIEKNVLMSTDSPRAERLGRKEKIIFPYLIKRGKIQRYVNESFEDKYPFTVEYLMQYRDKLDNRKIDNNCKWFEYGRSQALNSILQDKLLISTIISSSVCIYELKKRCIPYAGLYIVKKEDNMEISLLEAKRVLEDERFMLYIKNVGIPINGSSVRITAKDIENYVF
jgi:predicted RNA methylase